jgi:predicted DNA-binding transcriptional regulator AlpA
MPHTHAISPSILDDVLDERALLPLLRVKSLRTVRRLVARGELPPHTRIGRGKFWRRSAILAYLAEHESATGQVTPKRRRRLRTERS